MTSYRLSRLAEADIALILATSEERWGTEVRRRYATLIATAMRKIAADPQGAMSRDRAELLRGLRSFHLRHARGSVAKVGRPVHVLYYRAISPDSIELVRVLHERMEPHRHIGEEQSD